MTPSHISALQPIRDVHELAPAWERVEAQPAGPRLLIKDRFESLRDYREASNQEQFGTHPNPTPELPEVLPYDSVFLLNWLVLHPREAFPTPEERTAELRDQIWQQIKDKYGYDSRSA